MLQMKQSGPRILREAGTMRTVLVILTLAGLVLSGCGDTGTNQRRSAGQGGLEALRGISGDSLALSGASGEDGVAIVQGGTSTEKGPRATLTWASSSGQSLEAVPIPATSPLIDISTWWTGTEVAVFALECPNWTDEFPPGFDDDVTLSRACGNDTYSLLTWSPATAEWRLSERLEFTALDGAIRIGPNTCNRDRRLPTDGHSGLG